MANVTTIDITNNEGSATFPLNVNGVYDLVETIASQNIRAVKSVNPIEDAFYEYDVKDGSVIEEAIIAMANAQTFVNTGAPDLKPLDPTLYVKYFNNWEKKQFQTTSRITDIRNIIANKGVGFEEVISQIISTLSEGEGYEDMKDMLYTFSSVYEDNIFDNASSALFNNKVPSSAKGIIYCAREMFNALKSTNTLGKVPTAQATPVDDIRIAIPESILNLLDVTELANVFNLSKEELFGKLVVIPLASEDDFAGITSNIFVYDRKALGRGTRLFEYSQDKVGKGLYTNHYLTTDRIYFVNTLFKGMILNCSTAITNAKATLLA